MLNRILNKRRIIEHNLYSILKAPECVICKYNKVSKRKLFDCRHSYICDKCYKNNRIHYCPQCNAEELTLSKTTWIILYIKYFLTILIDIAYEPVLYICMLINRILVKAGIIESCDIKYITTNKEYNKKLLKFIKNYKDNKYRYRTFTHRLKDNKKFKRSDEVINELNKYNNSNPESNVLVHTIKYGCVPEVLKHLITDTNKNYIDDNGANLLSIYSKNYIIDDSIYNKLNVEPYENMLHDHLKQSDIHVTNIDILINYNDVKEKINGNLPIHIYLKYNPNNSPFDQIFKKEIDLVVINRLSFQSVTKIKDDKENLPIHLYLKHSKYINKYGIKILTDHGFGSPYDYKHQFNNNDDSPYHLYCANCEEYDYDSCRMLFDKDLIGKRNKDGKTPGDLLYENLGFIPVSLIHKNNDIRTKTCFKKDIKINQ
jgi:hypothetical protein